MIEKLITESFDHYLRVKQEVLKNTTLVCKCSNPGFELKCINCPTYMSIVDKVQHIIYENPKEECFNPSNTLLAKEIKCVKRYSQEDKDKAIELCQQTKNIEKVSKVLNIPYPTIYGWLAEEGIHITKWGSKYSEEFKKEIIELYYKYNNSNLVAKETGVSASTILRWVKLNLKTEKKVA